MGRAQTIYANRKWLGMAKKGGFPTEKAMLEHDLKEYPSCRLLGNHYGVSAETVRNRIDLNEIPRPKRVDFGEMVCPYCGKRARKKNVQQLSCGGRECIKARQREYTRERKVRLRWEAENKQAGERYSDKNKNNGHWPREAYVNPHHRSGLVPEYREIDVGFIPCSSTDEDINPYLLRKIRAGL